MPESEANESVCYNSLYRHGVDDKRRLQIPAKWRPTKGEVQLTLILWPKGTVSMACLLALPPVEWTALVQKIKGMPFADPKAEALRRIIGRRSDQLTVDKVGRICLPEEMAKIAGIEREAVLLGLLDRFEIWNPDRFEAAYKVDEEIAPEAFKLI